MTGHPTVDEPEVIIVPDAVACEAVASDRIAAQLRATVSERGRADWATTGGSSPTGIYRNLASTPLVDAVPWSDVHVWWGDDRFVPRDHPESNVKPFDDIMLAIGQAEEGTEGVMRAVPIPLSQVHPFPTAEAIGRGSGATWCAWSLAQTLRDVTPKQPGGWPALDLILLGVGPDGHILSVFPGSLAFDATETVLAVPAPVHIEPHLERVTLNPALVGAARHVIVVAFGADKAPVIGKIFGPEWDPRRWPAQLARRAGATWILDEAAAAEIPR